MTMRFEHIAIFAAEAVEFVVRAERVETAGVGRDFGFDFAEFGHKTGGIEI